MSSTIHDSIHFNSVEKALGNTKEYNFDELCSVSIIHIENNYTVAEFMDNVRKMICECVCRQYPEDNIDKDIENQILILMGSKNKSIKLSEIDLINSLYSINYQIEKDMIEKIRPLTVVENDTLSILNGLYHRLAFEYVRDLTIFRNSKTYFITE